MTKKTRKAVGIEYDIDSDHAPKVIAKGTGSLAEKIISVAQEHDIPIYEDQDLVEVLSGVDLYKEIPPEAYQVIAEILAFIYKMNNKWKEKRGGL